MKGPLYCKRAVYLSKSNQAHIQLDSSEENGVSLVYKEKETSAFISIIEKLSFLLLLVGKNQNIF